VMVLTSIIIGLGITNALLGVLSPRLFDEKGKIRAG